MRLTGVMPRSFSFLSTPIAVWIAVGPEPAVPASRWWLALRGAIGRMRPGVSQADAEKELREILVSVSLARRNFIVRATPIADLVYRPIWSYGFDLLHEHVADLSMGRLQRVPRPPPRRLLANGLAASGASSC